MTKFCHDIMLSWHEFSLTWFYHDLLSSWHDFIITWFYHDFIMTWFPHDMISSWRIFIMIYFHHDKILSWHNFELICILSSLNQTFGHKNRHISSQRETRKAIGKRNHHKNWKNGRIRRSKNNALRTADGGRRTDGGRTDGRTKPHIEMRVRI